MIWNRRNFLKTGGIAAAGLGLNWWSPAFLRRRLLAGDADDATKMVFIFQRGGSDGINTLVPHGDSEYNDTTRPTLYLPEGTTIDLGNNFAGLHPRMDPMMEIFNHSTLNGVDGPGNLALIHRVGYHRHSRSHFDSQLYWENGDPRNATLEEGMLYRKVAATMDPRTNILPAVSISGSQMVALRGSQALPAFRDAARFRFSGTTSAVNKLTGTLPAGGGDVGSGLLGAYGGSRDFGTKPYRDLVYGTGVSMTESMRVVQEAVAEGTYTPENGAQYPGGSFGDKLMEVAMLLKRTPVRILGVNIGGWDTHTNQGAVNGNHGNLLENVAEGYQALYRDLEDQWENLIIVNMTEFGRTSRENGSRGTDHAQAACMFVAGGKVKGGVYNCDSTTWSSGDIFSTSNNRYLLQRTDFRAVFAEIFMRHFGDDLATVNESIPGYSSAAADRPSEFEFLNFLPA